MEKTIRTCFPDTWIEPWAITFAHISSSRWMHSKKRNLCAV